MHHIIAFNHWISCTGVLLVRYVPFPQKICYKIQNLRTPAERLSGLPGSNWSNTQNCWSKHAIQLHMPNTPDKF